MALVLVMVGLTGCGEPEPEVDLVYQNRLDYIVDNHEFRSFTSEARRDKFLSKPPSWTLLLKIPETSIIEAWDAKHDQPQVMFTYGRDATVYTMNLNGTDVRQLLHRDELGELPYGGFTQRSPDGRYLALEYFASVGQSCALYDLKTRDVVSKMDACFPGVFTRNSEAFYYSGFNDSQPKRIDLSTGKKSNVLSGPVNIGDDIYDPKYSTSTFTLDETNERFIWTVKPNRNKRDSIDREQLVFKLSDMSLLGKENYLAEQCERGFVSSPDTQFMVCNDNNPYEVFSFSDPKEKLEDAPEQYVIQRSNWYAKRLGNGLLRFRQQGEPGMFDMLKYTYLLETKDSSWGYTHLNKLNYFIPPEIAKDFANYDLRPFFPTIPTQEQYDESLQRQLKEREEKLAGKRNKS